MTLTLVFQIDGRDYGLELDAVQEIIEDPMVYPVPKQVACLNGAVNVHGDVLPVIDLPALLGSSTESIRDERLIVLAPAFRSLVLAVERVGDILPLQLEQSRAGGAVDDNVFCRGTLEREGQAPLYLLDTNAVFERLAAYFD